MGRFEAVIAAINANVKENGNQEITGSILNYVLNKIVEDIAQEMEGLGGIVEEELEKKQDLLISGENIKTINGETLLGKGNIEISSSDAPPQSVEGFIPLSRDFSDDFNNDFAR